MARPDAERTANEESDDARPSIGTDPARTPEDETADESGQHRVVSPDKEKVKEHDRKKAERREHESEEEKAERIKDA